MAWSEKEEKTSMLEGSQIMRLTWMLYVTTTLSAERTNEEEKKMIVDVERKEFKQTWRKKLEDKSMDRNCAFNGQVLSPMA